MRGAAVDVATTWINDDCRVTSSISDEYGGWDKPLIVAVGGLLPDADATRAAQRPVPQFNWSQAAEPEGPGVAYWRQCLTNIKQAWGSRPAANLVLSFAHEANQNEQSPWYPWRVNPSKVEDFHRAAALFRQQQQEILPGARVAIVLNGGTGELGTGEQLLPDEKVYDLVGVDYYAGHYPAAKLETFTEIARRHGKSLILQEWGFNSGDEDSVDYLTYMKAQLSTSGGTGVGQIAMAVFFNANDQFAILNSRGQASNNPAARKEYVSLFGG